MITELVKAAIFVFPFFKELFLGKSNSSSGKGQPVVHEKRTTLKSFFISVAISSIVTNVILIDKLFTVSGKVVTLKQELSKMKIGKKVVPVEIPLIPPPNPPSFRKPTEALPREEVKRPAKRVSCKGGDCPTASHYEEYREANKDRLKRIDEIR